MDLDDLDIFSKLSTGTFAMISGLAIIGLITYLIYVVIPIDDSTVRIFSLLVFILGISIPVFFFMEDLVGVSDIVGKMATGITGAIIAWITYHGSTALELSGSELAQYIVLPAILTLLTSLILIRGVVISIIEGGGFSSREWRSGGMEFDDDDDLFDEDEDFDDASDEYDVEVDEDIHDDQELFPEEKDKW